MNCPTCSLAFSTENYDDVNVDVCEKCKGIWLDKGELELLLKRKDKLFKASEVNAVNRLCGASGVRKEDESRHLNCPKCQQSEMKTFNYNYSSGILVDQCGKNCGLWLDAEELDKIQIHTELFRDRLEANRERFETLAGQVEADMRQNMDNAEDGAGPSRFRFVNALLRGLIKF